MVVSEFAISNAFAPKHASISLTPPNSPFVPKQRQKLVRDATLYYLDFVGTAANPGQSCIDVREAMKVKYSVPLNSGVFYVRRTGTRSVSMVWCDFDLSVAGGGWTLAVNKQMGWKGSFKPALSWLAETSINTKKPSMSSDYKLPFATFFAGVQGAEIMLQYNPKAFSGSRKSGLVSNRLPAFELNTLKRHLCQAFSKRKMGVLHAS